MGLGGRNRQNVVPEAKRNDAIQIRHRFRQVSENFLRNRQVGNGDNLQSKLLGEGLGKLVVGYHIHTDSDLA